MRAGQPHSLAPHPNRSLIRIASSLVQTVPFLKRAEQQNCVVIRNKVSRNTGLSWPGLGGAGAGGDRAGDRLAGGGGIGEDDHPCAGHRLRGVARSDPDDHAARGGGAGDELLPATGRVPCTGRGRRSPGCACCPAGTGRARRRRPRRPPVLGVAERRRPGEAGRADQTRAVLRRSLVGHPVSAWPTFRRCPWTTARSRTRYR
jgi:hypothetical protein